MTENFHHCRKITLFLELSGINIYQCKKLVRIYQVEVSGKSNVARRNGVFFYKGVTKLHIVFSLCTIAKMSQQQLTHEFEMALHESGMLFEIRVKFFNLVYFFANLPEDISNGLRSSTAYAMHEGITRFHLQFHSNHSGPVLTSIVLFFHQQVQLIQAPHDGAILLLII